MPTPTPCGLAALATCLLALSACGAPDAVDAESSRRPNIIVFYADDLGWGDVAAQDTGGLIPTPHLDRLAAEGLRCTDAHSSSGICTPSRFALHTGQYHWRRFHGIVNSFDPSVFEEGDVTLPEALGAAGYDTALVGKWHLGFDWRALLKDPDVPTDLGRRHPAPTADLFDWSRPIPDGPLDHGYDRYFGDDVPNFPPYAFIDGDRVTEAPSVPYAPDPLPAEGHHEGRPGPMVAGWRLDAVMPALTERAVAWVASRRYDEDPFFLMFSFTGPHAPIVPSASFVDSTDVGPFGDFVAECDDAVGRVLEALDSAGLADDTIVVFSSDNGPEHYAYPRVAATGHRSMGPLRGLKRDVWEGGHRVPLLVRWPGEVAAGSVSDALVGQIDLMPTLLEAAGVALPDGAAPDGTSQLAVWRGEAERARTTLVHNTFADRWALRQGGLLYLDHASGAHSRVPDGWDESHGYGPLDQPVQLHDLSADLGQRSNLAAERPEVVAAMAARLAAIRAGEDDGL